MNCKPKVATHDEGSAEKAKTRFPLMANLGFNKEKFLLGSNPGNRLSLHCLVKWWVDMLST